MNVFANDMIVITFSDLKRLFFKNFSKIKSVSICCGLVCLALLFFREPRYVAEASFKQAAKQNEIGSSLREAYQQFFSAPSENAIIPIMQSNEVLKNVIEELGMQVVCNPEGRIVKAFKRIRDNFLLELGKPLSDPDPFLFRHVSYSGEEPLQLFLELIDQEHFQLFDQKKQWICTGKIGESLQCEEVTFNLHQIPKTAKLNRLYPLTIQPWLGVVAKVRNTLKIVPWKQDKTILKLHYASRDRFFAADFLNKVMKGYQQFLKRENDESCQLQLAYLRQREEELAQYYDEALIAHVSYLKDNLNQSGFIGVSQEIEMLSHPKNHYISKLFDVDLELQRLNGVHDTLHVQQDREMLPFAQEKRQLINQWEDCDLDQKRNAIVQPLLGEIEDAKEQLSEAKQLLECVEKKQKIPACPSLLKEPKSAIALLVKHMAQSAAVMEGKTDTVTCIRDFIEHLSQKHKILEENVLFLKPESQDFMGLNLTTARQLLEEYTRERDNLQAQMRELVFLKDHLCQADFEMSSLGGVFSDSVTSDLVQKAGAIALQLKDDNNRSDREQVRLHETLQTQKSFLSQHLLQTIELKKLRAKLLCDKITSLHLTTAHLLESEKQLLKDKLHELDQKMGDLPEKWRRESLLLLRKELGATMLQGVSQITETKNLGQHIFHASSKPLDVAVPATRVAAPKILILSFFASVLAGVALYLLIFCRHLFKGFPVTEENLKVSGFPISGSLSSFCNAHFTQLPSKDLETLRRIVEFVVAQPKNPEALVVSCIGGKYPNYIASLAELLSMRGLKVLAIDCVFDQVVHEKDIPGLWQYFNNPTLDLPLRRHLTFDHLPSGGTTRHGAEFIGSAKFSSFLSRMKQKYDVILLFSSADAATVEGYALLPISDSVIISVQEEKKDELLVYVDWANKRGSACATFVHVNE